MNIMYKLTDKDGITHNNTKWEIGVPLEVSGDMARPLCSDAWIHVYNDPRLAVIFNSMHAKFNPSRLFECEVSGNIKSDYGIKFGAQKCILTREMELPKITIEQRIMFGILCAKKVFKDPGWLLWANNWLRDINRSHMSANDAAAYAAACAADAAYAAACAACAAYAAACAARAADAAACAARAADAADAARAADAAYAAADAAACAAYAAYAAYAAADAAGINLIEIINQVLP